MMDTIGNFLNSNGGTIGSLFDTGAQLYGQQNAGQAISSAATSGINTATGMYGNINNIWQPQQSLGVGAVGALGSALGTNGQPANYSNFLNMPGYQFAVNQGTQAIQRQAAASGNAWTPNTGAAVGQYVTGTAMQDYNTYIGQLQAAAGLGSTANQNLTSAGMQTAGNIEQLGMNSGMAQAGMYTGMGQTLGGYGPYGVGGTGSPYGSGVSGMGGGLGGLVGTGLKAIGGWLGGGNNTNTGGGAYPIDPNNSGDMTGGVYNGGAFNGGAPLYDPSSGGYPGVTTDPGSSFMDNSNSAWGNLSLGDSYPG